MGNSLFRVGKLGRQIHARRGGGPRGRAGGVSAGGSAFPSALRRRGRAFSVAPAQFSQSDALGSPERHDPPSSRLSPRPAGPCSQWRRGLRLHRPAHFPHRATRRRGMTRGYSGPLDSWASVRRRVVPCLSSSAPSFRPLPFSSPTHTHGERGDQPALRQGEARERLCVDCAGIPSEGRQSSPLGRKAGVNLSLWLVGRDWGHWRSGRA